MQPNRFTLRSRRRKPPRARSGFSMLEMLIVMIVIAILIAISIPKMARIVRHERINRAAQVVAQDLQNGFAMAGRQRAPVRLTFYPSTKSYVFTDRATGQVLQSRYLSTGTEYSVTTLQVSHTTVDVLPNGIGSTSFWVKLHNGDYNREVRASSAGFVRMSPQ